MLSGGVNKWPFYKVVDSGTAYAIKKPDNSAVAAAPTDAVIHFNKMEVAAIKHPGGRITEVDLTHYQFNEVFTKDFLDVYAVPTEGQSSDLPEVSFMDGEKVGGTQAAAGKLGVVIAYGPIDTENSNKRYVEIFLTGVSSDSGDISLESKNWIKPTTKLAGVKCKYDLVVPEALFDSTKVKTGSGGIGPQTIPAGIGYIRAWLATA